MPEPSKKYIGQDRSTKERLEIVNHLQTLLKYKEISGLNKNYNNQSSLLDMTTPD